MEGSPLMETTAPSKTVPGGQLAAITVHARVVLVAVVRPQQVVAAATSLELAMLIMEECQPH